MVCSPTKEASCWQTNNTYRSKELLLANELHTRTIDIVLHCLDWMQAIVCIHSKWRCIHRLFTAYPKQSSGSDLPCLPRLQAHPAPTLLAMCRYSSEGRCLQLTSSWPPASVIVSFPLHPCTMSRRVSSLPEAGCRNQATSRHPLSVQPSEAAWNLLNCFHRGLCHHPSGAPHHNLVIIDGAAFPPN